MNLYLPTKISTDSLFCLFQVLWCRMLLRYLLLLLVGVARVSRAEYKWTGSEWVYLEDNRDTIEQYDVSILSLCLLFNVIFFLGFFLILWRGYFFILFKDLSRKGCTIETRESLLVKAESTLQ